MGIALEMERAMKEAEARLDQQPDFAELKAFYERMKREGIVLKREYELPPLDTIGKTIYSLGGPNASR